MKTILLADNDELFLETRAELLRVRGYEVQTATSMAEVNASLSRGRPDVAIMDVRMGDDADETDISGFEVAGREGVPIIFVTSYVTMEALRAAVIKIGPGYDLLEKQAPPGRLYASIEAVLRRATDYRTSGKNLGTGVLKIDEQLRDNYREARLQARATFVAMISLAVVGGIIILLGAALLLDGRTGDGLVGSLGSSIPFALSALFTRIYRDTNARQEKYHNELVKSLGDLDSSDTATTRKSTK